MLTVVPPPHALDHQFGLLAQLKGHSVPADPMVFQKSVAGFLIHPAAAAYCQHSIVDARYALCLHSLDGIVTRDPVFFRALLRETIVVVQDPGRLERGVNSKPSASSSVMRQECCIAFQCARIHSVSDLRGWELCHGFRETSYFHPRLPQIAHR